MGIKATSPPRVESSSSISSSSISSSNVTPPSRHPPVDKKLVSSTATTETPAAAVHIPPTPTTTISFTSMKHVAEMSSAMNKKNNNNNNETTTWIVINENVHDVTLFLDMHPGGDLVISNMRNKDCTLVFEAYHFTKLQHARAMLRRYCPIIGTVKKSYKHEHEYYPKHVQQFRAIQQELYNSGMFQVNTMFYYKLYIWLTFLFISSLYMTLSGGDDGNDATSTSTNNNNNNNIYRHLCGALLMACFWQQLAGLGHDLGHSNVSRNYYTDHYFGSIFGCSLSGISNAWWKRNHNTHHVVCNSVENDPDIQHLPTFAVSPLIIAKPYFSSYYQKWFDYHCSNGDGNAVEAAAARFMVSYQHYFLIPIMLVARFNMYAQSWLFLLNSNNKTKFRRHEMIALVVFAIWYSAVALSLPTYMETIAWILISHAFAGILHIQIIISHWAMETYRQDDDNDNHNDDKKKKKNDILDDDWYQLQLKTSMNIDCPPWMDWFHFGLQYQIEHHLFPSLPRHSLRHASRLVRRACREHDIPYHHDTFYGALCQTLRVLKETAQVAQQQSQSSGKFSIITTKTNNMLVDALNCNG